MLEICAISDPGKSREHNEDCLLIMGQTTRGSMYVVQATPPFLIAVADGVGGQEKGEVASHIALTQLGLFQDFENSTALEVQLTRINQHLCDVAATNPDHAGMATTLAGIIFLEDRAYTFHAGDSRVYRFRNGFLRQITTDHSLVQSLFEAGQISREEMLNHPDRNIILKALGGKCDRPLAPEVETPGKPYSPGDIHLVCSDGLSDMTPLEEIEAILARDNSLCAKAQALIRAANDHGGEDNISVILCAMSPCE